jgi:hypothetical protein
MVRLFTNLAIIPAVSYVGPGDIVSNARAWWGLRAYSGASIGSNAVRLREDGGNTEQDFVTVSPDGGLDLVAIATFKGANNLFVTKLYDQTGNGLHAEQTGSAAQPAFTLAGLGALPILHCDPTGGADHLDVGTTITQASPYTFSWIFKRTGSFLTQNNSVIGAGSVQHGWGTTADMIFMYDGTYASVTGVSNPAYHAVQTVSNTASSDINIDGTANPISQGGGALTGLTLAIFGNTGGGNLSEGDGLEGGLWSGAFSPAQSASMSANQHAYWGF